MIAGIHRGQMNIHTQRCYLEGAFKHTESEKMENQAEGWKVEAGNVASKYSDEQVDDLMQRLAEAELPPIPASVWSRWLSGCTYCGKAEWVHLLREG